MRRGFAMSLLLGTMLALAGNDANSDEKEGDPKSLDGVVKDWGKPKDFAPGKLMGYWIWQDEGLWLFRTTGGKLSHHFTGRIDVVGGTLKEFNGDQGEAKGAATDRVNYNRTSIVFDLKTADKMDGFSFKVDAAAKEVKFSLSIDKEAAPVKNIRIGQAGDNPADAKFSLPAHPSNQAPSAEKEKEKEKGKTKKKK